MTRMLEAAVNRPWRRAIGACADSAAASVNIAAAAGVAIGSGPDVVGPLQGRRGREIVLRTGILGAHQAIQSAIRKDAEIFGLGDIATVEDGKVTDLIWVGGRPLEDVTLADPSKAAHVLLGGGVVKDPQIRSANG